VNCYVNLSNSYMMTCDAMDIMKDGYFLSLVPIIMLNIQGFCIYSLFYGISEVLDTGVVDRSISIINTLLDINRLDTFLERDHFSIRN
jgi:hypothetical protein